MIDLNSLKKITDEELLTLLDKERKKYTKSNDNVMDMIIQELQKREVYPQDTVPGNPNSVKCMVNGWGAYWHRWSGLLECPHCKADFRCQKTGPPFKLLIGISNRDYVSHYKCHECGKTIDRVLD